MGMGQQASCELLRCLIKLASIGLTCQQAQPCNSSVTYPRVVQRHSVHAVCHCRHRAGRPGAAVGQAGQRHRQWVQQFGGNYAATSLTGGLFRCADVDACAARKEWDASSCAGWFWQWGLGWAWGRGRLLAASLLPCRKLQ